MAQNVIYMNKYGGNDILSQLKELFLEATSFTKNGHPVSIEEIGDVQNFQISTGDFMKGKYKFKGIARISINCLSQLYEFEGYENEIIGNINIKEYH